MANYVRVTIPNLTSIPDLFEAQSLLTVSEILKYTPTKDLTKSCTIRDLNNYAVKIVRPCNQIDFNKFYTREYVCYSFKLAHNGSYITKLSTDAISFGHVSYEVNLNTPKGKLRNALNLKPVLHARNHIPYHEISITPTHKRGRDSATSSLLGYLLFLDPNTVSITRLTKPYPTDCFDYMQIGFRNRDDCYQTNLEIECKKRIRQSPIYTNNQ